jgi:hypothetical protein
MAGLRFSTIQTKPTEILDLTSLTSDEFHILVPPFETAFQAYMREWRLDGKLRTARSYTTYKNCPLPRPEDRLVHLGLSENQSFTCRTWTDVWDAAKQS